MAFADDQKVQTGDASAILDMAQAKHHQRHARSASPIRRNLRYPDYPSGKDDPIIRLCETCPPISGFHPLRKFTLDLIQQRAHRHSSLIACNTRSDDR